MAVLAMDTARPVMERARAGLAGAALNPCAVPPLAMACGILLYFQAPQAWPPALLVLALMAGLAGRWWAARLLWRPWPRWAAAAAAWAVIGYALAGWATWSADTPRMADTDRAWRVEGWVAALSAGDRPAVTIEVTGIEGLEPAATPERVRLRVTGDAPSLGQGVRALAGLAPPPGPAAPGDYDFSRRAYFDRIGATGFSYGAVEPADVTAEGPAEAARRAVARVRGAMADRIRGHVPDNRGGILAALVTGDRSGVTEADTEALRASGLAHLLAISGLHMALVGGGAFAAVTFLLALIAPLSRAHDVRKPAAAIALLAATAYLAISGAPISTQRAYIMLAVMLIAVLADRRALTLRNVAVAAVAVLALSPESLFEAGFQMSFAAAAALIAAYEALRARRLAGAQERSLWGAGLRFFGALSLTSLVAGAATGGFAAFHFNRMATYGMAGNLSAMPLFSLAVMPMTALGAALMPFGLDGPAFKLAALGLGVILQAAEMVSSQDGALTPAPSGPPYTLALYSLGFALLCAGRGAVRAGGLGVMALAGALWLSAPRPILWVSDTGVAAGTGGGTLYATDLRRSRYGVSRYGQRLGLDEETSPAHFREIAACDSQGCLGWLNGVRLAAPLTRAAAVEDCRDAELIVFRDWASARLRRTCNGVLLDGGILAQRGPAVLTRGEAGDLQVRHADETAWRPPYGAPGEAG